MQRCNPFGYLPSVVLVIQKHGEFPFYLHQGRKQAKNILEQLNGDIGIAILFGNKLADIQVSPFTIFFLGN